MYGPQKPARDSELFKELVCPTRPGNLKPGSYDIGHLWRKPATARYIWGVLMVAEAERFQDGKLARNSVGRARAVLAR